MKLDDIVLYHSSLTDRVFIGVKDRLYPDTVREKRDITSQFIRTLLGYVPPNMAATIKDDKGNLYEIQVHVLDKE